MIPIPFKVIHPQMHLLPRVTEIRLFLLLPCMGPLPSKIILPPIILFIIDPNPQQCIPSPLVPTSPQPKLIRLREEFMKNLNCSYKPTNLSAIGQLLGDWMTFFFK